MRAMTIENCNTTSSDTNLPQETPLIGWVAIIASIGGSVIGLVTEWGVPTLNSLLAASLIYWLLKLLLGQATSLQTAQ